MLNYDQKQALIVLAETGSVSATSADTGVPKSTIYGWLQSPDFVAELTAISQISLGKMISGVYAELEDSITVLADTIHYQGTYDADEARTQRLKISAASNLLDRAERLSSTLAINARISTIERQIREAKGGSKNES